MGHAEGTHWNNEYSVEGIIDNISNYALKYFCFGIPESPFTQYHGFALTCCKSGLGPKSKIQTHGNFGSRTTAELEISPPVPCTLKWSSCEETLSFDGKDRDVCDLTELESLSSLHLNSSINLTSIDIIRI